MTDLNQKLSKACPDVEAAHHGAFKRRKKYLCNKLSVREGGGCLLEEGIFSGVYSTHMSISMQRIMVML